MDDSENVKVEEIKIYISSAWYSEGIESDQINIRSVEAVSDVNVFCVNNHSTKYFTPSNYFGDYFFSFRLGKILKQISEDFYSKNNSEIRIKCIFDQERAVIRHGEKGMILLKKPLSPDEEIEFLKSLWCR